MAEYRSQLSDLEPLLAADPDNTELQEVGASGCGRGRDGERGFCLSCLLLPRGAARPLRAPSMHLRHLSTLNLGEGTWDLRTASHAPVLRLHQCAGQRLP